MVSQTNKSNRASQAPQPLEKTTGQKNDDQDELVVYIENNMIKKMSKGLAIKVSHLGKEVPNVVMEYEANIPIDSKEVKRRGDGYYKLFFDKNCYSQKNNAKKVEQSEVEANKVEAEAVTGSPVTRANNQSAGENAVEPTADGNAVVEAAAGGNAVATAGNAVDAGGNAIVEPTAGGNAVVATAGGNTVAGENTVVEPTTGGNAAAAGRNAVKTAGGNAVKPADGGNAGGNAVKSTAGGNAVEPAAGGNAVKPTASGNGNLAAKNRAANGNGASNQLVNSGTKAFLPNSRGNNTKAFNDSTGATKQPQSKKSQQEQQEQQQLKTIIDQANEVIEQNEKLIEKMNQT